MTKEQLRQKREELGLTVRELAGISGVGFVSIVRFERGENIRMHPILMSALCKALAEVEACAKGQPIAA